MSEWCPNKEYDEKHLMISTSKAENAEHGQEHESPEPQTFFGGQRPENPKWTGGNPLTEEHQLLNPET